MPSEDIGEYQIEFSGVWMADVSAWAAWVTVYGPAANPMHRNNIVPAQRVSVEHVYGSEAEAEAEARKVALSMLTH